MDGHFINGTDEVIKIEFINYKNKVFKKVALKPKETYVLEIHPLRQIKVKNYQGDELYSQNYSLEHDHSNIYRVHGKDFEIYYLILKTSIHPILKEYQKNWEDHLEKIKQSSLK